MNISIDNSETKVTLSFIPSQWFLCYGKDDRFGDKCEDKVWTLNPRIDRSEKGKDDDVGIPFVYLGDEEAEVFKKAGFSYLEI